MAEAGDQRVPVCLVAAGDQARTVADRLRDEPRSLGVFRAPTPALPNVVALPAGCPCCTGRVALAILLARQVRQRWPDRVYVEVPDPTHASQLAKVLASEPLSRYLRATPMGNSV